jgi:cofilin
MGKMLYASSKESIKRKLDGIFTEVQCTDAAEISHEAVLDKVSLL